MMMNNGILPKESFLTEVWCADVPDSVNAYWDMLIDELRETTDEYVIYHVTDITGMTYAKIRIKNTMKTIEKSFC